MDFVDKLIADTKSDKLSWAWKFSEPDKYTFSRERDPMKGLNFSASEKPLGIIFPNGSFLDCDVAKLDALTSAIRNAIVRDRDTLISDYTSGLIEEQAQQAEEEKNKKEKESLKKKAPVASEKKIKDE